MLLYATEEVVYITAFAHRLVISTSEMLCAAGLIMALVRRVIKRGTPAQLDANTFGSHQFTPYNIHIGANGH